MGVYVDKEYRVKRKSSENGRKSAFAHKVKNGGKNYSRNVQERINRKGASKEVVVKISGGAITRQGIRNSIDYMSRESELPVMSESGRVWTGDEILEAKEHMIDRANDPQHVMNDKGKENKKITQNIVFSPPVSAKVKPEDLLESVRKTMQKNILITVLFLDTTVIRKNILTFMLFFVSEIMTVNALISGKKIYGKFVQVFVKN